MHSELLPGSLMLLRDKNSEVMEHLGPALEMKEARRLAPSHVNRLLVRSMCETRLTPLSSLTRQSMLSSVKALFGNDNRSGIGKNMHVVKSVCYISVPSSSMFLCIMTD